ncbi:MAG: transposase [Epulopiscium sp.]|nr:transposase [Candidatus Epulonipiscium sp.]
MVKRLFYCSLCYYGFNTDFVLTPANVDDREAVWELVDKYESITVIGDKGYINKVLAKSLWGLITRLRTKILAHNLCYFIHTLLGRNINIGNIKELIFG